MPPIRRHPALAELSRQHHQGLILAQLLKKNPPVYRGMPQLPLEKKEYTLQFFQAELLPHFRLEEEKLAPFLLGKDATLDKLLKQMLAEHKALTQLAEQLKSSKAFESVLEEMGMLLERHIRMEERDLFMLAQQLCQPAELEVMEALLAGANYN